MSAWSQSWSHFFVLSSPPSFPTQKKILYYPLYTKKLDKNLKIYYSYKLKQTADAEKPSRDVLQNSCSALIVKNLETYVSRSSLFSKVAGFRTATLLKNELLQDNLKGIWPKFLNISWWLLGSVNRITLLSKQNIGFLINLNFICLKWRLKWKHLPAKWRLKQDSPKSFT